MKTYENKVTGATIEVYDDVIVVGETWKPVQPAEQLDEDPAKKGKKGGKKGSHQDLGEDDQE